MMITKTDNSSNMKHVIDENQYKYFTDALGELMKNEDFTDIVITTNQDINYLKKVHGLLVDCFCKATGLLNASTDEYSTDKSLVLHHEADVIEYVVTILYFGKCVVPVSMLPKFMDLSNYLKISELFIYDERGSDYFVYLMQHKNKLLNYLCFSKKNCINCDAIIISKDFKNIPIHRTILAVYSPKFILYYKNRIENKNPTVYYVPSNSVQIENILKFCYFGQIIFSKSDLKELTVVVTLLGIDRFLKNCTFSKKMQSKKRFSLNLGIDFIIVKPPEKSDPAIIDNIKENSKNCYVYLWKDNRCVIIPTHCFHSYNFRNDSMNLKTNIMYDVIIFHNNVNMNLVKRFVYCLYTKDYSTEIEQFIDLFGLQWPYKERNTNEIKTWRNDVPLYADNVEDLQTICDKVFKAECSKDERIIQLFNCQICGIQLLAKKAFVKHCREHEDNRLLCEKCGQFICESSFPDHIKKHHKTIENVQCDICLKRFASIYGLKKHQKHCNCFYEKCTVCNKRLKKGKMGQHKAWHAKKFDCSGCNKNFRTKKLLQIHQTSNESGNVKCLYCHLSFPCKSTLRSHVEEAHYTNFYCSFCTEYFKTRILLSKHSFEAHSDTYGKCDFCGKTFNRFESLQIHLRKHSGDKLHRCKFCTKSFSRFNTMYDHVQMVHEKRRYVCPACNRKYSSKYYFIEHGWLYHQQFFSPNLHLKSQGTLTKLDPRKLFNQITEISESLAPKKKISSVNKDEFSNDTTHRCTLCTSEFSVFNDLISHLETHV